MEKIYASLDISFKSIVRFFIILLFFVFLYFSVEILMWFFLALIISVLLNPFVDYLQLKKIPRALGAGFVYITLGILTITAIILIAPSIVQETRVLVDSIPQVKEVLDKVKVGEQSLLSFALYELQELREKDTVKMAIDTISIVFKGTFALIVIVALSFFLSIEKKKIRDFFGFIFPKNKNLIKYTLDIACRKIHLWFMVRVINCLFVAVVMYFVLLIAGVSSPLLLAFLIGMLSFIPLLGSIVISILILGIISILNSIQLALIVFVIYFIVNFIADYVLTPVLSKKILDISSSLVLIAIVIGGHFYGVLGAILAIPAFAIVLEFTKIYIKETRKEDVEKKSKRVIINS